MGNYSHLYKTGAYVPPSVVRAIEEATPTRAEVFGDWRTNSKTIEAMTGQSRADNLLERKLKNREFYKLMKNKTIYSTNTVITSHAAMNTL